MCSYSQTGSAYEEDLISNEILKKIGPSQSGLLVLGLFGTNLSFEVVLPFGCL